MKKKILRLSATLLFFGIMYGNAIIVVAKSPNYLTPTRIIEKEVEIPTQQEDNDFTIDLNIDSFEKIFDVGQLIDYDYLYIEDEQIIYANADDRKVYDNPKEEKREKMFELDKRQSLKSLGYNKYNDTYKVEHLNGEVFFVDKSDFDTDKNLILDKAEGNQYISSDTSLLDYPSEKGNKVTDVKMNDTVTLLAKNDNGYYKVSFGEKNGFVKKNYLSKEKINYVTEMQQRIANIARNNQGSYPCTANYCAAWVEGVYQASGVGYTSCYGNAIDYWNKWNASGSTSLENIPIGAVVVGSGSGSYMGNTYGHVGVYIGNGQIAENIGYHNITDINSWIQSQRGTCQGHHGFIGWVWPYNNSLGEGY